MITAFRVEEKVSEKYFEAGFGVENTQETPKKRQRNNKEKAKEKPKNVQEEILKFIKSDPQITVLRLSELLKRSQDSTRYHLRQLTNEGIIKHEGSTKAGKWVICIGK